MSRNVQIVILCEDPQHEAFARRFLERAGKSRRIQRVERSPKGSAEQFVRLRYPEELEYYRTRKHRVEQALIVLIDGDKRGVENRIEQLETACQEVKCKPRREDERVAIFVPTWNIETWLAYLDGQTVDEKKDDYPRLKQQRDCQGHVKRLFEMCQKKALRKPSPPSLDAACEEYQTRLQS